MDSSEELGSTSSEEQEILEIDKKYMEQAFNMILSESKGEKRKVKRKYEEDLYLKSNKRTRSECGVIQLDTLCILSTDVSLWVSEMREFLHLRNFTAATDCLYELLDRRLARMYCLWKVSAILLLCHPNLPMDLVKEFLQMNCGQLLPTHMQLFVKQLFNLPNSINGIFNGTK